MHSKLRRFERRAGLWFGAATALGVCWSCASDPDPGTAANEQPGPASNTTGLDAAPGEPGPGAFDPNFETSPAFFTRMSTTEDSNIHYQQRTWYSQNLADFPRRGPFIAPEGSVAIKTEATDEGEHFTTMVMIKREAGYDPEGNDWYYEVRNPDGSLDESPAPGRIGLCRSCHAGGQATDYLLAFAIEN